MPFALRTGRRQTAGAKLARRRRQHSIVHLRARVLKNQTGNRRAIASFCRRAQLTYPAKVRSGSHHAADELHVVELKIAGSQQAPRRRAR